MTRQNLLATLDTLMGGRAAEELIFGNDQITSGCSDDLNKATNIAIQAVLTGIVDKDTLATFDYSKMSEKRKFEVDKKVQRVMTDSLQRSKKLLTKHRPLLETLAKNLMNKDTLDVEEVTQLMKKINL
jgi:ATP-dependent metalloprotease